MQVVRLFPYCISHQNLAAVRSHLWPDFVTAVKVEELAGCADSGNAAGGVAVNKMNFLAGICAFALVNIAAAQAADLRMPVKAAPVYAPVYSWAGWYAGVHAGYGWGDPSADFNPATAPLPPGVITLFVPAPPFTLSTEPNGWLGGVQLGYNWQFGQWVVGVEGDFSFTGMNDDASRGYINTYSVGGDVHRTVGAVTLESELQWFGTFRGRFGYAFDRFLPYVTAGLAVGHVKTSVTNAGRDFDIGGGLPGAPGPAFSSSASFSDTLVGVALGGGLDWAISDRWSLRGEYLYLNFNGKSHAAPIAGVSNVDSDFDAHIGRIALNYRFAP
jgi:opacity protein-like surface antigen